MTNALEHVCCARLPASGLAVLADLRREPAITVTPADDHAWVQWEAGSEAVLRRLLPVSGVELYSRRDGLWYRPGAHLPSFEVPVDLEHGSIPLARAVTPRPIRPIEPDGTVLEPIRLGLAREATPRDASALQCALPDLGHWIEMACDTEIAALEAAWSGEVVLIRGRRLPAVAGARYWGNRLLTPLGFRPDPGLPELGLRRALGVAEGEVVVLAADGFETIPLAAFQPLTRAGVRLAMATALPGRPLTLMTRDSGATTSRSRRNTVAGWEAGTACAGAPTVRQSSRLPMIPLSAARLRWRARSRCSWRVIPRAAR